MTTSEAVHRPAVAPAPRRLRELGYGGGVRLAPGPFADRLADAAATYGGMAVDDVLKGFRRKAGLPAPGADLLGWARETSEATFGQWVSGLARLSAVTGDAAAAQHAADLVDGYAATLPASGDTGMGTYGWEKLVCGLVDSAVYGGNDGALDVLSRVVRGTRFDLTRRPAVPNDFAGDGPALTLEWYTLPENLYRGYLASGDGALADFAALWHYDTYWDRFAVRPHGGQAWDVPVWLHAYSHVNTFASVAAAYDVHRDPKHLEILRNAHDWVTTTQCFGTGGYGPSEFTLPEDGSLGRSLEWRTDSAEIVCGSWAAFKLCTALLTLTGEARYADWVETLLYSGLGATTPVRPGGRTPYYADYRLGVGTKLPFWDEWPCCSGTYVQAVAHLADLVYFADDDGLAVTLYVPSDVTWSHAGREVTLSQRTDFPTGDTSTLRVDADGPVELALRLRAPSWTRGMSVRLNGTDLDVACVPGEWAVVSRTWEPGDELTVRLGAGLRALPVDRFHPNRVMMAHGPVALVQDAEWSAPFTAPVPWQMVDWESVLVREDGLAFRPVAAGTHRQPVGGFRPYYEIPDRWPYRMYHDLANPRLI